MKTMDLAGFKVVWYPENVGKPPNSKALKHHLPPQSQSINWDIPVSPVIGQTLSDVWILRIWILRLDNEERSDLYSEHISQDLAFDLWVWINCLLVHSLYSTTRSYKFGYPIPDICFDCAELPMCCMLRLKSSKSQAETALEVVNSGATSSRKACDAVASRYHEIQQQSVDQKKYCRFE